jgi:hypothetical protein
MKRPLIGLKANSNNNVQPMVMKGMTTDHNGKLLPIRN